MENDDKMRNKGSKTQLIEKFLEEESDSSVTIPKLYNLEDEFEKTKKNKNLLFVLSVFLFIAFTVSVTFLITRYIEYRSLQVKIDIEDFQDLNLKDVLDTAKKNETDLNNAKRELSDLNTKLQNEIQNIKNDIQSQLDMTAEKKMPKLEKDTAVEKINDSFKKRIEVADKKYSSLIKDKEVNIRILQRKIAEYDKKQINVAKKNEEIVFNQQKLYELKIAKLTRNYESHIRYLKNDYTEQIGGLKDHYNNLIALMRTNHKTEIDELILKYNPIYDSGNLKNLTDNTIDIDLTKIPQLNLYSSALKNENICDEELFKEMRTNFRDRNILMSSVMDIPFTNSVPKALYHIDYYDRIIMEKYEMMWSKLAGASLVKDQTIKDLTEKVEKLSQGLISKDKDLQKFIFSFETGITEMKEIGFIQDATNKNDIVVYLKNSSLPYNGEIANVMRNDSEKIGTVLINVEEGKFRVSLVSLTGAKEFKALDRIVSVPLIKK